VLILQAKSNKHTTSPKDGILNQGLVFKMPFTEFTHGAFALAGFSIFEKPLAFARVLSQIDGFLVGDYFRELEFFVLALHVDARLPHGRFRLYLARIPYHLVGGNINLDP